MRPLVSPHGVMEMVPSFQNITAFYGSIALLLSFFCIISAIHHRQHRLRRLANPHNFPYPPGPKPLPIIGNLFEIACKDETATYQRLAQKFGDLVFLSTLGKNILFVNSFETANLLFEKRSSNYSDRTHSTMSHELMGWDFSLAHMPYGERWRKHRRMFHRQFQQSVSPTFWPVQTREAHALLRRLLHSPENLDYHLRFNAAAVIMSVAYGITIDSTEDPYVALAEKALEGVAISSGPGAFLVDLIPALKHVPDWFPGASFKCKAREWRAAVIGMREAPFAKAVEEMQTGQASSSFVSNLLSDLSSDTNHRLDEIETIKNCAGIAYAAGAESTVSTLTSFVLAILTYPEVQTKAQKELDTVVGRNRLPDFNDRSSLPYITAIVKEVLRWNPVAPLGLPHMTTKADEFNGYFIPAGTIVVGNTWGILNDPMAFPDPRRFNPDRFMGEGDKGATQHLSPTDTLSAAFGYGRRFCPGRYMGEAQVWISVACILSVFEISPALDEDGVPLKTVPAFSSGLICHPLAFKFSMKPRGDRAISLIEQTELTSN